MTIFKWFIKDYENVNDENVRTKYGIVSSILGIIINLFLVAFKMIIGIIFNAISLIADGVNNLADSLSSIINILGFKLSNKKPDKKHPYGYQRVENICALIISLFVIFIGFELLISSIKKIINKEESTFDILIIVALGVGIVLKFIQFLIYKSAAKKINSLSLKATSSDSLNDIISTSVILLGFLITLIFDLELDSYLGILVSAFIIYSGIKLVFETISPLIGEKPDIDLVNKVNNKIHSYKGVLGLHDMEAHLYGKVCHMSVHVEVSRYVDVMESHDLIDCIEMDIKKEFGVCLTIHLDPIDDKNEELGFIKENIKRIINNIDSNLLFHDVRMVKGITHTNIIFDIVVPYDLKIENEKIKEMVEKELKEVNPTYLVVINFDNDYVGLC